MKTKLPLLLMLVTFLLYSTTVLPFNGRTLSKNAGEQLVQKVNDILSLQKKRGATVFRYFIPFDATAHQKYCIASTIIDDEVNLQLWKSKSNDYWIVLHKIEDLKRKRTISILVDTQANTFSVRRGIGKDSPYRILSFLDEEYSLYELQAVDSQDCIRDVIELKKRFIND